ncbi:MAG: hypothetical protein ABR907_01640 [Terracidiphilus sp.]|jgi:hypothetical protein
MKNSRTAILMVLAATLAAMPAFSQDAGNHGQAVVTVLPKDAGASPSAMNAPNLTVKVAGKDAKVTKWELYKTPESSLEVVLLFDDSSLNGLGTQRTDIEKFINNLPPGVKAAIGYMQYGRAVLAGPLSADHAAVLTGLRLPSGAPGSDSSPYFCLSDLAKHWPSKDGNARREVVMVTDGADYFQAGYDPNSPDLTAAIADSARAGLVVYSIYWMSPGFSNGNGGSLTGESLLNDLTTATGGTSYWEGTGNPVSFAPYFKDIMRRFQNQYQLGFVGGAGSTEPKVETLKVKLSVAGANVSAPHQVLVVPATSADSHAI